MQRLNNSKGGWGGKKEIGYLVLFLEKLEERLYVFISATNNAPTFNSCEKKVVVSSCIRFVTSFVQLHSLLAKWVCSYIL